MIDIKLQNLGIREIQKERDEQHSKWGAMHDDGHTTEEWARLIEHHVAKSRVAGNFQHYMIHVAALALAAWESSKRQEEERLKVANEIK